MRLPPINRFSLRQIYWAALVILTLLIVVGWRPSRTSQPDLGIARDSVNLYQVQGPIQSIPLTIELNQAKVALGEELFQDVRLSADNQVSCLSCHRFNRGGADHQAYSVGANGIAGDINALTVFNAGFNFRFNWNGEFETLEEQIHNIVQSPKGMGSQWRDVVQTLAATPDYVTSFAQIYPDGLTEANIVNAIATYVRSLYTPNSRLDQYLKGDEQALNRSEKEGYQLFQDYGCISCHQGLNVGGNMFQKFGVISDSLSDRERMAKANLGRYHITHDEADRFMFRVPSLRNVALTAPYLHDGSIKTLAEMVKIAAKAQLGRSLSQTETNLIVQFLKTLTGEYQGRSLEEWALDLTD